MYIYIFLVLFPLYSSPSQDDVCLFPGTKIDSLLMIIPRNAQNAGLIGILYTSNVFLKRSSQPRAEVDSALAYFARTTDSSASLQAYRYIAQALRLREDSFIEKLVGTTNKRANVIFQSADTLVRNHAQDPVVVFLVANLFAEAHKKQTNAKWYWNRSAQLFEAFQLFIQAEHLVDPEYRSPLVNPEICGMVELNLAKLQFKLAGEEEYALPEARKKWAEVITRFPNTLAAANAQVQLEKYKL